MHKKFLQLVRICYYYEYSRLSPFVPFMLWLLGYGLFLRFILYVCKCKRTYLCWKIIARWHWHAGPPTTNMSKRAATTQNILYRCLWAFILYALNIFIFFKFWDCTTQYMMLRHHFETLVSVYYFELRTRHVVNIILFVNGLRVMIIQQMSKVQLLYIEIFSKIEHLLGFVVAIYQHAGTDCLPELACLFITLVQLLNGVHSYYVFCVAYFLCFLL